MKLDRNQFLGLPSLGLDEADAVVLPLPLERTVSYGKGTAGAPRAILDASCQIEFFDEETLVDFEQRPRLHTLAPLADEGSVEDYLERVRKSVAGLRGKFLLSLGGEHTVTWGVASGLAGDLSKLTVVQIDAHADLIDELDGLRWSHGTVMRRLWENGCRLVQIGVRSLSRSEYELARTHERIVTFYAHELAANWGAVLSALAAVKGETYLTVDVDGLDPSVIPSTGAPQPDGLTWARTMEVIRALTRAPQCELLGADVVEFVPSPNPPGCDIIAARLAAKILAFWFAARKA